MDSRPESPNAANILVVDDTPGSLHFLSRMLKERGGYKVRSVTGGALALEAARELAPDLILLDVDMPDMNGYEVCARLKACAPLQDVPVLFLSALDETSDKIRGFQVGGVDYISKPIQFEEVAARVRTHLELRRQKRELQEHYERLRELESLRDNLIEMLVHDMRSPLMALRFALRGVRELLPADDQNLVKILDKAGDITTRLTEMINQMLDISRFEAGQMPLHRSLGNLVELATTVRNSLETLASGRRLSLSASGQVWAYYDPDIVSRVLSNLINNAIRFTSVGGEVTISVIPEAGHCRVTVADTGPGIPPEFQGKIFGKFFQVEYAQKKRGIGLGLHFCKLAVEAQGGRIGVDSAVGLGSTFWFTLPSIEP
jgi:two-component system, sensor histidine kinase and response regulator